MIVADFDAPDVQLATDGERRGDAGDRTRADGQKMVGIHFNAQSKFTFFDAQESRHAAKGLGQNDRCSAVEESERLANGSADGHGSRQFSILYRGEGNAKCIVNGAVAHVIELFNRPSFFPNRHLRRLWTSCYAGGLTRD